MNFDDAFKCLTGNPPFPWQKSLYDDYFNQGKFPSTCNLPTGLGKTSVVAVWLIALANQPDRVPRRLVYVVNRRTVVDQTTAEVEKYQSVLQSESELRSKLGNLCAFPVVNKDGNAIAPLALSALRGQLADNREWSADPARPAVIVGTVDMIGSRLLFSGYGVGFKGKPLHAGFLGQDVLLVHDEAHLEPAFQELLIGIEREQKRCSDVRKIRVIELSATSRGVGEVFGLTGADESNIEVKKRIQAKKSISLHGLDDEKKLSDRIAEFAQTPQFKDRAILVFVRKVDDVNKVVKLLPKGMVQQLTGALRGRERDRMADPRDAEGCPIFARFLRQPSLEEEWKVKPQKGTVYLVCTSAGEVGVNISADHMVCDLSTYESMAQRFGRVNRFGERRDTEIHVVHPLKFDENEVDARRANTLELLRKLNGDGSPKALSRLPSKDRLHAFAPTPQILPTSDFLFDAWALSTIKNELPGRPPVDPYLHGVEDNQALETQFAWREEVCLLTGHVGSDDLEELMDQARLKPHELLRVTTFGKGRAYDQLQKIADRSGKLPVWIIEPDGSLIFDKTISQLVEKRGSDFVIPLGGRTVILPPEAGGLSSHGMLEGDEGHTTERDYDVVGLNATAPLYRFKVRLDEYGASQLELVAAIAEVTGGFPVEIIAGPNRYKDLNLKLRGLSMPPFRPRYSLKLNSDDSDGNSTSGVQEYLILQPVLPKKGTATESAWPTLSDHLDGVRQCALRICEGLKLDEKLTSAIVLSGAWHDLGKSRAVWQRGAGNTRTNVPVSKTIHGRPPENLNCYRHELGSLIDICGAVELATEFDGLTEEQRDIVLHLVAAHHGRARPHFSASEAHDIGSPDNIVDSVVNEIPARFARLQRTYGRWGLAYLESILRAADILDSQRIEGMPLGEPLQGSWERTSTNISRFSAKAKPAPSFGIGVDPANPGQFFACCGLFELANRLWPGTESWFENNTFQLRCNGGTLGDALNSLSSCHITNTMSASEHSRFEEISSWNGAKRKSTPGAEEEYKNLAKLLREAPIVLCAPFDITIDWFIDDFAGGSRFKTWAGQQSVLGIAKSMKLALSDTSWRNDDCLKFTARGCGLPFNFDSDLGGQGGAIDVGFSFDPLAASSLTRIEPMARPALELLAFIGLQRFRAAEVERQNLFRYTAWNRPLPIEVAAPAACGMIPMVGASQLEFRLLYRTKYLKSFLPAIPFTGGSDE